MTLESALLWSTCRAVCVASVALPIALAISRTAMQAQSNSTQKRILIAAALLPLFVPDLLIGFTYRLTSARLIHSVFATECLYAALLLSRIAAFQFAVQLILPCGGVSREAMHTWNLRSGRNAKWWSTWVRLQIAGPARAPIVAWLGGATLCFQEFETAALLQIDRHPIAWTVWLFDAHAAGEPLIRSLGLAVPAIAVQCIWLVPCLWLLMSGPGLRTTATASGSKRPAVFTSSAAMTAVAVSLCVVLLWPLISNGTEALRGMQSFVLQGSLWKHSRQISWSLMECGMAAFLALQIGMMAQRIPTRSLRLLLLLPGLCGSLVLSLCLLAFFQLPLLHSMYDTWLPMVVGHMLLLLPRAFLLVTVLNVLTPAESGHSVTLLSAANHRTAVQSAGQLTWILHQQKWLLALAVLTHWCFWDVTVAATLRPVRFEPIITRLYNEMHYGRTETLTAITGLALLIPAAMLVLIAPLYRRLTA